MRRSLKWAGALAITVPALVISGFLAGSKAPDDAARVFDEVLRRVANDAVDSIPAAEPYAKAAPGLVGKREAPYADLTSPEQRASFPRHQPGHRYRGPGLPHAPRRGACLFGEEVKLPDVPFMLAFVSQAPIYPLFIVRTSFHHYKIIARPPIHCLRSEREREGVMEEAMRNWSRTLESVIGANWSQWFSLVPIFPER